MRLADCHNIDDFRSLAKARLPFPVVDYIDGAADDELTKARNTAAFAAVDLVPDVLAGVETIDTSCTILGRRSALPLMLSVLLGGQIGARLAANQLPAVWIRKATALLILYVGIRLFMKYL